MALITGSIGDGGSIRHDAADKRSQTPAMKASLISITVLIESTASDIKQELICREDDG